MTLREALIEATHTLASHHIDEPHLEAELLLRHVLRLDRVHFYISLEQQLPPEAEATFANLMKRRLSHEPTAYITGHQEFYGIDLLVDRRALIPRPESELVIDTALDWAERRWGSREHPCLVTDIGTGCGNIAIALAVNLPGATIYATDISAPALELAAANCQRHHVEHRTRLLQGCLLEPLPEAVDLLVANLPYVKNTDLGQLAPGIRLFEPAIALDGGEDGLDKLKELLSSAGAKLRPGGAVIAEIGFRQGEAIAAFVRTVFPKARVSLIPDLANIPRVLRIETEPLDSYYVNKPFTLQAHCH